MCCWNMHVHIGFVGSRTGLTFTPTLIQSAIGAGVCVIVYTPVEPAPTTRRKARSRRNKLQEEQLARARLQEM